MAEKKTRSPRTRKTPATTRARKSPAIVPSEPAPNGSDDEIARLAYTLWEQRGRPMGSPEEDWHQAKEQLKEGSSISG